MGMKHRIAGAVGATALAGLAVGLVGGGAAQASTVVGIEYADANYAGSSLNVTVGSNGFTCTGPTSNVDASLSSMPSGWNDRISSFRSYANCWERLWENTGFTGSSFGYAGTTGYVGGAMNDRTSSIQYS